MMRRNRSASSNRACVDECIVPQPVQPLQKIITKTTSREEFCDVQFTVEGKVVAAHRIILADRSDVFRDKFMSNELKSVKTDPIPIVDTSYDAFSNFINTIYYGHTPDDAEICLEMIKLAEKYNIQDIKSEAESSVIASINTKNAVHILITSELRTHRAERIKQAALEFCARNGVHEMNNGKELAKHPDLMIEMFKQMSLAKKNVNNTTFIAFPGK